MECLNNRVITIESSPLDLEMLTDFPRESINNKIGKYVRRNLVAHLMANRGKKMIYELPDNISFVYMLANRIDKYSFREFITELQSVLIRKAGYNTLIISEIEEKRFNCSVEVISL